MERDYFPLRTLTRWIASLWLLLVLGNMLYILHVPGTGPVFDWNHHPLSHDASRWHAGLIAGSRALLVLALLILTVAAANWRYRAVSNARRLDAATMRFTPGWAVFWLFAPVLGTIIDGLLVLQLWRASHGPGRVPATTVWVWWLLSLISTALSCLSSWPPQGTAVTRWLQGPLLLPVTLVYAVYCLAALMVMLRIQDAQSAAGTAHPMPYGTAGPA